MAFGRNPCDKVQVPVELSAGGVDREENRVEAGLPGRQRRLDREVDGALERPAVRLLDDVSGGGDLDDDAGHAALAGHLHVGHHAAGEGEDLGVEIRLHDRLDRRSVLGRDDRHARLDSIDARSGELAGKRELVVGVEGDPGLLLAVAQRNVVKADRGRKRESRARPEDGSRGW